MALRQEDLDSYGPPAPVYRFPVERSEVARIRQGIAQRRAARRRHRAGLGAVAIVVILMTLLGGGKEAIAPAAPAMGAVAVVQPGETLWEIAERHAPEGMDVRAYVDFLVRANDIGPVLQAGTRIRLP